MRVRHFAYCASLTKAMVRGTRCLHGDTQLRNFVLVTLLPTVRSQVSKNFSGRSQSKTSWPPLI